MWLYSDAELDRFMKKQKDGAKPRSSAYKGLGEMNAEQLWDTTMNPATRTLFRVEVGDEEGIEADHVFRQLMGDDVAARRRFIEIHANEVQNLDV